ncbi:RTA1 like protein [Aspergillus ellipticus CBS 707.79]|uniref:RTA1 like protein n=1 Tax=Aspergillus ellipticus CBS 707.79 TaxID=1448320 RepID=A0A319CSN0_9EURO|nr:RTA1 like protein [Aspergillus ellipticus CBS 707.79]
MVKVKYLGLYNYRPSIPAAAIFAVIFAITTGVHIVQLARKRCWFMVVFAIGGLLECIGYIARAYSSTQYPNYTIGPMLIAYIFILVAPALLAASIYMELGRIMIMTNGSQYSLIRRTWLTKIFVVGDILSFFIQFIGAAMLAKQTASATTNGENLMKLGVLVQIIFFGLFVICAAIFHLRFSKSGGATRWATPWKKHLLAIYACSGMIFVRSIFRLAEFFQSSTGYLMQNEWVSYVFDAMLMVFVMGVLNAVHPAEVVEYIQNKAGGLELGDCDDVSS